MSKNSLPQKKAHWEEVYKTKPLQSVSWYQSEPLPSLKRIDQLNLDTQDPIMDIGGGDSLLADHLLNRGFSSLTVLDISTEAIERAKKRLGEKARQMEWIASDILDFVPTQPVRLWHDRAAFHFLTSEEELNTYRNIAAQTVALGGHLIMGTFSVNGPKKCSGLEVRQYHPELLQKTLGPEFRLLESEEVEHQTPGGGIQLFLFATLQRMAPDPQSQL